MDSGPVPALQLWDQPLPASVATGPAAANGAGPGLHVIAGSVPASPAAPAGGPAASAGGGRADPKALRGQADGPDQGPC
jgi:hypothetical protein